MRGFETNPFHRAIYLTGPTASGKTAVGVALARRLGAEIVALDSMTLYRGMDIGTAKPTADERQGVPHHLLDVLDPWESSSVAQYRAWAAKAVAAIEARGPRVLFVGGTALYLKALLRGLFDGPGADPSLRRELDDEVERLGVAALHARLAALDPATAARLHPNDRRRVVRALEVVAALGRPLSALQVEHDQPAPEGVAVFALSRPREQIRERIDRRVLAMFEAGLVDEVRALCAGPRPVGPIAAQGVGYREVIAWLQGEATLEATLARVQARTRQFAKRQETWFRGLSEVKPWPLAGHELPDETARQLAEQIDSDAPMDRRRVTGSSR
jgi:tRNA dimethylallyltransferase